MSTTTSGSAQDSLEANKLEKKQETIDGQPTHLIEPSNVPQKQLNSQGEVQTMNVNDKPQDQQNLNMSESLIENKESQLQLKQFSNQSEKTEITQSLSQVPEVAQPTEVTEAAPQVPEVAKPAEVTEAAPQVPEVVKPAEVTEAAPQVPEVAKPTEVTEAAPQVPEVAKPTEITEAAPQEPTQVAIQEPPVLIQSTPVSKSEEGNISEDTKDSESEETSKHNQKALEFLASTESNEQNIDEKGLDMKQLTSQILNILNEERADKELSKEQLMEKSEDLQNFISKLVFILAEKTELCVRLEQQNAALIIQAKSLKNVVGITKDLLGIRNMEVEHLHADLKIMEESISAERTRHDTLLKKLAEAMNLNEQLKNEYHTQSGLFQALREKYHEKIILLTKENQRLKALSEEGKEVECENRETEEVNNTTEVIEK